MFLFPIFSRIGLCISAPIQFHPKSGFPIFSRSFPDHVFFPDLFPNTFGNWAPKVYNNPGRFSNLGRAVGSVSRSFPDLSEAGQVRRQGIGDCGLVRIDDRRGAIFCLFSRKTSRRAEGEHKGIQSGHGWSGRELCASSCKYCVISNVRVWNEMHANRRREPIRSVIVHIPPTCLAPKLLNISVFVFSLPRGGG